jgi:transcriptional regulator with XRE-family HTH domain
LAEKLGYVTNSYVSDVESGHFIPSGDKLKKIARALDVSFKEIEGIRSRVAIYGRRKAFLMLDASLYCSARP